jgi:hypothetical protein
MTDIQRVREAIELFMVYYFDTIEMSGTVKSQMEENINYVGIDLKSIQWDEDLEKLHHALAKYLAEWSQKNFTNFEDYISISKLTIEYLLPEKGGANQNKSKHLKLFHLPTYYYSLSSNNANAKPLPRFLIGLLDIWHNILIRNTIVTIIPTIGLIAFAIYQIRCNAGFEKNLTEAFDYINVASGIIASFVLGFLIDKVITIRQDKLKYTKAIRVLSNKLSYFRNICYNLSRDHTYWSTPKVKASYEYANSIKHDITFEEYHYPNYDDDIQYAKFKAFYREDVSHPIVTLVLQLHRMADDSFLDSGLTYTKFPPNHIYSHEEINRFVPFTESNQIWYCASELRIFPDKFQSSYFIKMIIEDINRIYPKNHIRELSADKLEEVSLDFQYRIIPRLYHLTRIVGSGLPLTIKYFMTMFVLLLAFGLILPVLIFLFISKVYAFLSVFPVIGIICHILLTLNPILQSENTLDSENDYL